MQPVGSAQGCEDNIVYLLGFCLGIGVQALCRICDIAFCVGCHIASQTIGIKAQELQKAAADGLSSPDAIIKAFEENPELAAQYEAEYMGR